MKLPGMFMSASRSKKNWLLPTDDDDDDDCCFVTAPPIWRNGQRPQDVEAMEDDDVVFECNVIGRPNPTVSWTYNAQSLDQGTRLIIIQNTHKQYLPTGAKPRGGLGGSNPPTRLKDDLWDLHKSDEISSFGR